MNQRKLRDERGQTLVLMAFFIAALMGIVALVVDAGILYRDRRNMQNAADAASLAGAAYLPGNTSQALNKAREWALKNGIESEEIEAIEVNTTNVPNDTINVKLRTEQGWLFGRVLGMTVSEIKASSAAMKGSPVGLNGLMPWVVTNEVFLGLNPGNTAVLKYDAQDVVTGNFQPIALDGTGANIYRETIQNGSLNMLCVVGLEKPGCPSSTETEPGNVVGPTRQALQWVIQNTPTSCNSFGEVFTTDASDPGKYTLTPTCNPFNTNQPATSVAIIPVIDDLCNGSCEVNVLRFAMFFIEGVQCTGQGQGSSCSVVARYAKTDTDVNAMIGPYDPLGSMSFVRLTR